MLIGKTCFFSWSLVLGSTTAFTGNVAVGLPYPTASRNSFPATLEDTGTRNYAASARNVATASTAAVRQSVTGVGNVNATNPFTWTTGDLLVVSGSYETT